MQHRSLVVVNLPLGKNKEPLLALIEAKKKAREAVNAENKAKTVVRNIFKETIAAGAWELGTYVVIDDTKVDYSASDRYIIPAEALYEKVKKGEITLEKFLQCVSVNKDDVTKTLGSDVVLSTQVLVKGDKFDIRLSDLPTDMVPSKTGYVVLPEKKETSLLASRIVKKPSKVTIAAKTRTIGAKTLRKP
jgi:hypothetical protein